MSRWWARSRWPTGAIQHWLRLERWQEGKHDRSGEHLPADVLPALRDRAVRAGVSRLRGLPHARGAQRAGLQPLRGHALLRQQLPVPRAPVQLVQLHVAVAARRPAQPRRHGAAARRHGEVHHVRAAHRRGQGSRPRRGPPGEGRRDPDRVPADLPDAGHHLRQPEGRRVRACPSSRAPRAATTCSRSSARGPP